MLNKSLFTNLLALACIAAGYYSPVGRDQLLSVGFFAFSGAVTNWLAVYMLFEKVPLLYGSGVVPSRFEEFKGGIRHLIMTQFFTDENVDRFFHNQKGQTVADMNFEPVVNAVNYDSIFDGLLETVRQSSFGPMLGMIGGIKAFEPMRQPFKDKIRARILDLTRTPEFIEALENNVLPSHLSRDVVARVEEIVNQRLDELTPQMVKEIVQEMIAKHLGWLVVWGGVFGGLIGLGMSFVP